jgi:Concanavalin A-like lectin/glucanases superfamily
VTRIFIAVLAASVLAAAPRLAVAGDHPGFVAAVKATRPLAYFRFETTNGASVVGKATYAPRGGLTISAPGAPVGAAENHAAYFNGTNAEVVTTQKGGIGSAGSIMAWVYLNQLPSKAGRVFYVAGETESGNDFDLQFEAGNALCFYTLDGPHASYVPNPASLLKHWHMVVATFDVTHGLRAIYWDGKPAAVQHDAQSKAGKRAVFTIGESSIFPGRWFEGQIDEVALWNRALSPNEVAGIYGAAR